MVGQMQHQLEELKQQLKNLTQERQKLTERSEEIFILSRIDRDTDPPATPETIIKTVLKMFSELKGIPFCAYGVEDKNKIENPVIHVNYAEASNIKTFYLNALITQELQKGIYYTDRKSKDNVLLFDSFRSESFTPDSILLISHPTVSVKNGIFIFADHDFIQDHLSGMKTFLEITIRFLNLKLDKLYMQNESKKINLNLEKIVSDRTAELWNTNNLLRNEIEEKKKNTERLKQMNEKLNNFVYRVSHDLRAPITSVEGLITVIKFERKAQSDKVDEYINILEERIHSLDRFIRDILSHSRISNSEVQLEKIQFKQIIKECFDELNYMENHERIDKKIRVQGGDFINDRIRIYEIFRNLISNAIKYSDPNKKKNQIQITVKTDRKIAAIHIQDTGIGINKEVLPRIFEMFFRGHEHSKGTGIGLYIVKEAVKKLKGNLKVQSTPGQGTLFSIQIPNRILEK
jgi:signal transduction histidine kinase